MALQQGSAIVASGDRQRRGSVFVRGASSGPTARRFARLASVASEGFKHSVNSFRHGVIQSWRGGLNRLLISATMRSTVTRCSHGPGGCSLRGPTLFTMSG